MFELTIDGKVYQFKFGMGFLREINKKVGVPMDGVPDVKKNIGSQYYIAGVIDKDLEALVDVLDAANKTQKPRVTRDQLDAYIEHEDTDVEKLFEDVMGFLSVANVTKKIVAELLEMVEQEKAKQEQK